ncbi:MAG: ATP synthase F1 subunit epsilon [Treponema sp.]|jgi:F-type H+-transporting ATPase subunit epsilon|nr:ATP synthase F1 subunit epsilon [Treponema sp.]
MPALFNFEVHTPRRVFYSGRVQAIIIGLEDGQIGIYANHSSFTAHSVTGTLRIKDNDGNWRNAFVCGGILEVKEHKNVLMVESADWPEEIDREKVLEIKRQSEEILKNSQLKFEIDKAKKKLHHAECRLKVLEEEKKKKSRN